MAARSQRCADLMQQLADYLDEEPSEAVCQAVESHMADCADCTAMVNTLRKTIDLYHRQPPDSGLPTDIRLRLFRRLQLDDLINAGSATE